MPPGDSPASGVPSRREPDVVPEIGAETGPPHVSEPVSAAHARLGSEALARLRGRYADVLANLARRVPDEQRRQELREQAEKLNPDTWVTDEEVTAGLDGYEAVLASLREVVGRRRRRRRGRGSSGQGPGPNEAGPGAEPGEAGEVLDGDSATAGSEDEAPADEAPGDV